MDKFTKVAVQAVEEAGAELLKRFQGFDQKSVMFKTKHDIFTPADLAAEKIILDILKKNFPEHSILSEESGLNEAKSDYLWIVDPLDGTTNFASHNPNFCSCLSLVYKKELLVSAIYFPILDELFTAEKGKGAFLNNQRIQVSLRDKFETSFITYCNGTSEKAIEKLLKFYRDVKLNGMDPRQFGSAGMETCWIACGRVDSVTTPGISSWDAAPGALIIREAGGRVTDFSGKEWTLDSEDFLGSNGKIHQKILDIVSK